jgi:hypothetical protein
MCRISKSHFFIFCSFFFLVYCVSDGLAGDEEKTSNKAVSAKILKRSTQNEVSGEQAGKGHIFVILETEWENIHPKQKVDKDKLEGKTVKLDSTRQGGWKCLPNP